MSARRPIGIAGAGSLGQAYAALLTAAGDRVVLLASPRAESQLRIAGSIRLTGVVSRSVAVDHPHGEASAVGLTSDPAAMRDVDGVLFATKGHQLPDAISTVADAVGDRDGDWWVAGVQNGLAKDVLLGERFGLQRLIGAVSILGAGREADGTVRVGGLGMTYLGEFVSPTSNRCGEVVARLTAAGIPAEVSDDITSVLWSKACNAVGIFGVSVLTRLGGPQMWVTPELVRAYRALIRETDAVAQAYGVQVGDYVGFPIRRYLAMTTSEHIAFAGSVPPAGGPTAPGAYPSMTQDLFAGRTMEVEEVFGDIVTRAERVGVAVPRISLVCDLLRGLNNVAKG